MLQTVVHEGKNRVVKCNCNHNWKRDVLQAIDMKKFTIILFDRDKSCPKCNLLFWITVKRKDKGYERAGGRMLT